LELSPLAAVFYSEGKLKEAAMKTRVIKTGLMMFLLMLGAIPALAENQDMLKLKDGSVLLGTITEENDNYVIMVTKGIQRKISRGQIVDTYIASESPAPAPSVVTAAPVIPQERTEYYSGVAEYYKVPVNEVVLVERQGIPAEEVPVAFFLAGRAHVGVGAVVKLRLGGMSWMDVTLGLGLRPDSYYVAVAPPAYERHSDYFLYRPRREWRGLRLADADVVNCVNLRVVSNRWHAEPREVLTYRRGGQRYEQVWGHYAQDRGHGGGHGRH
jgi:hypothetical protein